MAVQSIINIPYKKQISNGFKVMIQKKIQINNK